MCQESPKKFSASHISLPSSPLYHTKEILKIQRKISKVSILTFWAFKLTQNLLSGICLHFWAPDAFFDTHIAISRHYKCQKPNVSFMSKMPKRPYLTQMPSDTSIDMAIWVSKDVSGSQECRPIPVNNFWISLTAQNFKILTFKIFLCIF